MATMVQGANRSTTAGLGIPRAMRPGRGDPERILCVHGQPDFVQKDIEKNLFTFDREPVPSDDELVSAHSR